MATHRNYGARVRIWDSGDSFADRYTILPPRTAGADWRSLEPRDLGRLDDPATPDRKGGPQA